MAVKNRVVIAFLGLALLAGYGAAADGTNIWKQTAAAGLNLTSGNSENLAANLTLTAERVADDPHEVRMEISLNYGESDNTGSGMEKDTDNGKALAVYRYKMSDSYAYTDNSIFYDDMADIDYRLILGGGAGYFVISSDSAKLGIELGLAYVKEEMTDNSGNDNISARIAFRHDQKIGETSKLWLSAEYLPSLEDGDDYLANGEFGIEAAINAHLSLRLVTQDRYDSTVPADTDNNDLSIISSLVVNL
jgi:putative salt-induced outer membrane protein YdiY